MKMDTIRKILGLTPSYGKKTAKDQTWLLVTFCFTSQFCSMCGDK